MKGVFSLEALAPKTRKSTCRSAIEFREIKSNHFGKVFRRGMGADRIGADWPLVPWALGVKVALQKITDLSKNVARFVGESVESG